MAKHKTDQKGKNLTKISSFVSSDNFWVAITMTRGQFLDILSSRFALAQDNDNFFNF